MCWSAEVSLKTYLFGMLLATLAKINKSVDNPTWLFLVLFTHIQLVEYFLWKNIDNPERLQFWSKIGAAIIVAQPFFIINMVKDQSLRLKLLAGWTAFVLIPFLIQNKKFETKIGENGHLEWNWFPSNSLFFVAWITLWFLPLFLTKNYKFIGLALAGFIPSLYFFLKYKTWGSMWCWISVLAWLFYFQS